MKPKHIKFRLDGKWEGSGMIETYHSNHFGVRLDSDCKEFEAGELISVYFDEIVTITNENNHS